MNSLNGRLLEISKLEKYELYPPFPKKNLLIEVTNKCNSNCIFCANSKMKRKRKYIDPALLEKILKEAFELGMIEVGFYTTGESLLDNNLSKYIKLAKNIGYKYIYITTNAILLNNRKIKELVDAGIDSIKLSINAINKKDYEFIHGVNYFDTVISNLKSLYNYRKNEKLQFKIYVSYIATRYTDYSVAKIKAFFADYCDEVAVINVRNQSGLMPEINKYLSCEKQKNKIKAKRILPCHYVFNTVNVSCEGYLTACCTDFENYLVYADLNKETLKDSWHNEVITELRRQHLNKKLEENLCNNCIYSSESLPIPLNESLCTAMTKEVFDSKKTLNRIEKYTNL